MGNNMSLADNQSVEYQSGAGRLCNSIFMAICVAPLLILGMCGLLGYNERRAVCDQKAIYAGRNQVKEVGCADATAGNGALVMFNCDIQKSSLPQLNLGSSDFSGVTVQGTGIRVDSAMYQCVEHDQSHTEKNKGGGGGTHTVHTYTYSREWSSTYVDSSSFHAKGSDNWRRNCGQDNPSWDSSVPRSKSIYAPKMNVGAFTTTMTNKVPLNTPIVNAQAPAGWRRTGGTSSFYRSSSGSSPSNPRIGDAKVSLYSNDPNSLMTTVLGKNLNGAIDSWTAPSSWLCSGFGLEDLRMGSLSKDQLFDLLASEASSLTWILRFIGFGIMWFAFCLCFGPLEVAADCIPCIGPFLGDSIHAVACCVSCLPATACTLGVCGIVWVAMRPLVGIPLMIVWLLILGGLGAYIAKQRAQKQSMGARDVMASPGWDQGSTGLMAGTTQMPVPVVNTSMQGVQPLQQPRQMMVTAPAGVAAGQAIQFQTPEGQVLQATVPPGVPPGGQFPVSY